MTATNVGLLLAGLAGLVVGAELLVQGAKRFASALGVSPLLVGLTLVSLGTSSPEIAVSVEAALAGRGGVALGNVAGSNIFNVLVVLGASAMVAPLVVQRQLVRLDVPIMAAVSLLPLLLGLDRILGRGEGLALLALGVAYISVLAVLAFRERGEGDAGAAGGTAEVDEAEEPPFRRTSAWTARLVDLLLMAAGLTALALGAGWLIDAATEIARQFGVSELVIGLTLVAAATSLPEMATSVLAAARGERDIAVGNAVGSNIFNVLFVLGAAATVSPDGIPVPTGALTLDLPVVILVAFACLPVFFTGWQISRWEGGVFVLYYAIYVTYLLLVAATHDARDEFVTFVVVFVVPLTLLMALGGWWWAGRDGDPVPEG